MYNGLYTDYPYDEHDAELEAYALATMPPAEEGQKPEEGLVPISMEMFGSVHGFKVLTEADTESAADFASVTMKIKRASTTLAWATFVMITLWLMALSVAGVTFFVLITKRRLEFASFTWIGAMLFAFVSFRSAAPGVPPIGSLFDVMSFFWAEIIVALSLVTTVGIYLVRPQK